MKDDNTSVMVRKQYHNLIRDLADFHGITQVDLISHLILSFALGEPIFRQGILELGFRVEVAQMLDMPLVFEDSLVIPEKYQTVIINDEPDEIS